VTSTSSQRGPVKVDCPDADANLRFLATLPLFSALADDELNVLARVTRLIEVTQGDELWREGDEADGLYAIVSGRVAVDTRLPAEREVEIATLGPDGVLGEIPLLGGGRRWASVRALEDSRLLFLDRREFGSLVSGASPGALVVRRRLLSLVCDRLRQRHEALAEYLGGEPSMQAELPQSALRQGGGTPPREEYLLRLPFFRSFDRTSAVDVLRRGVVVDLPVSEQVATEGAPATGCWITLNGAVEELIRRGDRVIRVSLAGPGHAFGYLGLIDGRSASVAAATRERSRLLFLPAEEFQALFDPTTLGPGAFRQAIEQDLVRALRASWHPQARLAVDRATAREGS
jgi:CRP/FNR family cyclic AMP-dependent transcriptional regulator